MNILWLSHLLPFPPQGIGVLQRSANLLKAVAEVHQVDLVAFNQPDLLRIYDPDLSIALRAAVVAMNKLCRSVTIIDIECNTKLYGKFRLALTSLFSRQPYTVRWLASNAYAESIATISDGNTYDVIWFDTISLAQYSSLLRNNSATKILNHHNIESDMMYRRAQKECNYFKKLYFYLEARKLRDYEAEAVSKFSVNVTCSELDSRRLKLISPDAKTCSIPNGVDTDFFRPDTGTVPDPYSLVFAGGMSWYPNRDAMLYFARAIWPGLKREVPGVNMHVVGESPPAELIALAGRDLNYHVYGFVDNVRAFFYSAGIYVCPISDGGGTKLKVLDALAMGIPVVANRIACEGIDVTNGEDVIFAETPEEYISAISNLISDPSLREMLGRNARKLVLNMYSYDAIGRDLLGLFETCSFR